MPKISPDSGELIRKSMSVAAAAGWSEFEAIEYICDALR